MEQHPPSTKALLEMVHAAQAELAHVETVMKSAKRFGDGALAAIRQFEETREMLGLSTLKRTERESLENRIQYVISRCDVIVDTLPELKERLKGQINVVRLPPHLPYRLSKSKNATNMTDSQIFGLMAQKDSRTSVTIAERQILISQLAAQDSRVMRIIGILTLLFLPTTLVTVCCVREKSQVPDISSSHRLTDDGVNRPDDLEHQPGGLGTFEELGGLVKRIRGPDGACHRLSVAV
jgi:hypothetical protein